MKKARAISLLGGTVTTAARALGVTRSALSQWPAELPARLEDRVLAALVRLYMPHVLDELAKADGAGTAGQQLGQG